MSLVQVMPQAGSWKVVVDGTASGSTFSTQREAEQAGRSRAREIGAEFQLHSQDGSIREKDSYGGDPSQIPG